MERAGDKVERPVVVKGFVLATRHESMLPLFHLIGQSPYSD